MSYKALYRTYRPKNFNDFAGQKHILKALQNSVKDNKIAHAYIFCGPRGTGKTSMAKLLAKSINCLSENGSPCDTCANCISINNNTHPDIIEIDAASNNGVDEVRDLIDKVKYAPNSAKYKVYIIDEVHMMSTGAFNALLKTLEEPPKHVIFILATTEPNKVLPTILSRCQRFDFAKISKLDIQEKLKEIILKENIMCSSEAVELMSELADGGMRDALSILDQVKAYAGNKIDSIHVREIYGVVSTNEQVHLLNLITANETKNFIDKINQFDNKGVDFSKLVLDILDILKEILIYKNSKDFNVIKKLSKKDIGLLSTKFSTNKIIDSIDILIDTYSNLKRVSNATSLFELACLKIQNLCDKKVVPLESHEQTTFVAKPLSNSFSTTQVVIEKTKEEIAEEPVKKDDKIFEDISEISLEPETEIKKEEIEEEASLNLENIDNSYLEEAPEFERPLIDKEALLNILVQAKKEYLVDAKRKWIILPKYMNSPSTAKPTSLLLDGNVVVAAENALILTYENDVYLSTVLKEENNRSILDFLNALYKKDIVCYYLTKVEFENLKNEYLELRRQGSLPNAKPINKTIASNDNDEINSHIDLGEKLFGDKFEVKEE